MNTGHLKRLKSIKIKGGTSVAYGRGGSDDFTLHSLTESLIFCFTLQCNCLLLMGDETALTNLFILVCILLCMYSRTCPCGYLF